VLAVTETRPAGLVGEAIGELRSGLIVAIVTGELLGPITPARWHWLGRRYDASSAELRRAALELCDLGLFTVENSRMQVSQQDSWRLFAPPVFRELNQLRGREALASYMDARQCVDPTLCALAAQRRCAADGRALSQALESISAVRRAAMEQHERIGKHRTGDECLREAIARAARNRYLAETSARLRRHRRDAEWATEQALVCPAAASLVEAVTGAILAGHAEHASHAAEAEIDLFESWAWRRLADLARDS
jgi:DNA-binding FadR family transcriptional regulator